MGVGWLRRRTARQVATKPTQTTSDKGPWLVTLVVTRSLRCRQLHYKALALALVACARKYKTRGHRLAPRTPLHPALPESGPDCCDCVTIGSAGICILRGQRGYPTWHGDLEPELDSISWSRLYGSETCRGQSQFLSAVLPARDGVVLRCQPRAIDWPLQAVVGRLRVVQIARAAGQEVEDALEIVSGEEVPERC